MQKLTDGQVDLLCALGAARSLQQVADLAFDLLGNPVFFTDMSDTILAYTRSAEIDDPDWRRSVVEGGLESGHRRFDRVTQGHHYASVKNGRPITVRDGQVGYSRVIKVVVKGDRPCGVLVCSAIFHEVEERDIKLVDYLAGFAAAFLQPERSLFTTQDKAVENFIKKLLESEAYTESQVERRLESLEWRPLENLYVLALLADRNSGIAEKPPEVLVAGLSGLPCCRALVHEESLVLLYSGDRLVSDWRAQAPELTDFLRGNGLTAGVSRQFHSLAHLRYHFLDAQMALRLGVWLERRETYYLYNNYSCYNLFLDLNGTAPIRGYCHEKILYLRRRDREEGGSLSATLQVYLEQAKSFAKTADILHVHRNTVRYRVKKCMELMETDLEDGEEIFSFILSLRILEFEDKVQGKYGPGPTERGET